MDIAMIDHLDHLVLTSNNEEACVRFYVELLGMRLETFAQGRKAFVFGNQKINLHIRGKEFEPKAHAPTPGALDLRFITTRALEEVIATFQTHGSILLRDRLHEPVRWDRFARFMSEIPISI